MAEGQELWPPCCQYPSHSRRYNPSLTTGFVHSPPTLSAMKLRLGILVPLGLALLVTPVTSRAIKLFDLGDDDGTPTRVQMEMDRDVLDNVDFWDTAATSATPITAEVDLLKTHGPYDGYGGFNAQALQSGSALPMPRSVVRCPPGGCNETFWAERNNKRQTLPSPLPTTLPYVLYVHLPPWC